MNVEDSHMGPENPPPSPRASPIAPLTGTRVLDLSQNLAGPYGAQILADLGADVVKVEPPGGDPARRWGPPFIGDQSPLFQTVNRNKRSVVLDLKSDEGRNTVHALATDCDVFLQAFRQGVPERLGIDYERIRSLNPSVIYVSVTAFGTDGPLRDAPGYDPLLQARSGLMSITGNADGPPARVGASVIDLGTGMWTAIGVLGAILEKARTGEGCHVETSLLDTSLALMSYHLTSYLATGEAPTRRGTAIGMIAPYEAFPCSDGEVMISAGNDLIFRRLCEALELDLADRDEYATNPERVSRMGELAKILAGVTCGFTVKELLELLARHRVPSAPIHTVAATVEDEQVRASGMLRQSPHPDAAGYVDLPAPISWNGRRAPARRHPPRVGEHQSEVLGNLKPSPSEPS